MTNKPNDAPDKEPRFMTAKEAADVLRMALVFIRDEIKAGNLKAYKVGREYRIERLDFEAYLQERVVKV